MLVEVLHGASGDPVLLGGKGATLDRLVAAGLPVPATAVVTTDAYRQVAAREPVATVLARLRSPHPDGSDGPDGADPVDPYALGSPVDPPVSDADIDAAFAAAAVPAAVATAIVGAGREVAGGRKLAVRSSATVEDLHGSSFAGQYRSELDIDPADGDELLAAVARVWASLWHRAPRTYRQALGVEDGDAAMAVVLMAMVPAQRAGVVFTVDPGGAPGAARVEAVTGLGEALVSGRETPEAWVLPRTPGVAPGEGSAAPPAPVTDALALALGIEERFGVPQDVEWAWDGSTTWVVQARPITVAVDATSARTGDGAGPGDGDGFDSAPTDHELTTTGIEEMLPGVLPPLRWELDAQLVEHAFRRVLDELGVGEVRSGEPLIRRVRGRAVLDFTALQAMASSLPGAEAGQLEAQYFGLTAATPEASRRTRRRPVASLTHAVRVVAARRRAVLDAEVVCRAAARIQDHPGDVEHLDDRDLLGYRLRLIDLAQRGTSAELAVAAAAGASYHQLEVLLSRHLGQPEGPRQAQLVSAGGTLTVAHPSASAAVFAGPTWAELGSAPPPADRDGRRDPVPSPGPSGVEGPDPRSEAVTALLDRLTSLPAWRRHRVVTGQVIDVRRHVVQRLIAETGTQLARRERTKAAILGLGGEVRRIHLELGRRLQERGVLPRAGDVELCTTVELVAGLAAPGSPGVPAAGVLARRARYLARCERAGPLPPRFPGDPDRAAAPVPAGQRLTGWAAGPGRRTGRATVIRSPRDDLPVGDVLVAAATDASWSPLFLRAGAIVAERGGPLSHAAILARELGLPAVLNLPGATSVLAGRLVTVDGDTGVVIIHDDDGAPSLPAGSATDRVPSGAGNGADPPAAARLGGGGGGATPVA